MIGFLLFHGAAITSLAWISYQDWKSERFNLLIPLIGFLVMVISSFSVQNTGYIGSIMIYAASVIGVYKKYIRLGDIVPIGLYSYAFTSLQSLFTLLTVTGLYLYSYPKIRGEKEWVPYLPALLISYLVQLLFF